MNGLGALAALIVVFAVAGPAAADSLVFIKNDNVWLANADGSSQYQVTLDGTAGSPYSSPSQADDGTIVALRTPFGARPQIWRMHQNRGLLNAPINTPAPGTGAIDARVSPDGRLVAYWFVTEVNTGPCLYCPARPSPISGLPPPTRARGRRAGTQAIQRPARTLRRPSRHLG